MSEEKWVRCNICNLSFPSLNKYGLCGLCNHAKKDVPTLNKWLGLKENGNRQKI